jgi:hypothetical protein
MLYKQQTIRGLVTELVDSSLKDEIIMQRAFHLFPFTFELPVIKRKGVELTDFPYYRPLPARLSIGYFCTLID